MIITKKALPRRTVLRGIGATLALPLLDSMVPALSAVANTPLRPVRRLGFVYIPNGANPFAWTPSGNAETFELSEILNPLAGVRDQVVVPSGLAHRQAEALGDGNGEHARACTVFLGGVHPKRTEGADVRAGTTVDQLAAAELGKETPLPSLELTLENNYVVGNCDNGYSCAYVNTISWRTPTTPLPMEYNPRVIFERMFGEGGTSAERLAQIGEDRSILDALSGDMARLQRTLGVGDRTRVAEYLDTVREVERRIQRAEVQASQSTLPQQLNRPVGAPESFHEHAALMYDLLALAFQADVTRVFTFLFGREATGTVYPESGVLDPHHPTSHHQNDPVKLGKLAQINRYHVALLARFVEKLQSLPEGDGTVLNHSLILYGGGISDPNLHSHYDLPLVMVGGAAGRIKGQRHLQYPRWTPMSNLLLGLLDKVGVPTEKFGDSTGRLNPDPLSDL